MFRHARAPSSNTRFCSKQCNECREASCALQGAGLRKAAGMTITEDPDPASDSAAPRDGSRCARDRAVRTGRLPVYAIAKMATRWPQLITLLSVHIARGRFPGNRCKHWCRRWDSNPHGVLTPTVFETVASTHSATSARLPASRDDAPPSSGRLSGYSEGGWGGAEDGGRTRDLLLGKEALYH